MSPATSHDDDARRRGDRVVVVAALLGAVARAVRSVGAGAGAAARRAEPATHPFGLDELGRDILVARARRARASRCWSASSWSASRRSSGSRSASIAGYFGGGVDQVISRVMDVLLAFPGILLAIALVAVLGPSLVNVVLALSVIGWVGYARLVRGQVLRAREFEFVRRRARSGAEHLARADASRAADGAAGRDRAGDARHGAARSCRRRRSAFWASACSRRRRAGARCSTAAARTCSTRRI